MAREGMCPPLNYRKSRRRLLNHQLKTSFSRLTPLPLRTKKSSIKMYMVNIKVQGYDMRGIKIVLYPSAEIADSNESVSYIKDEREPLPDKPLQLVRPDPLLHKRLVLVEENVKHLHFIKGAVAVVVVVGKFHSGKSFLLNQLMGKQKGFGIGPSVKPQTMGIWMWGKVEEVFTHV